MTGEWLGVGAWDTWSWAEVLLDLAAAALAWNSEREQEADDNARSTGAQQVPASVENS